MDIKSFFYTWKKHTKTIEKELYDNWYNRSFYTSLIQNNSECVLDKIAEEFNLKYYREYYALDAVFYNVEDKVPDLNENWVWLRNIKIAFEHEHDFYKTYQEISHLNITNCELSVLVTYPYGDEAKMLKYYTEIVNGNRSNHKEKTFLLIFGYQSENDSIEWKGLYLEKNNWLEIN